MAKHTIVRLDNVMGTKIPGFLRSVKYGTAASDESLADVDNGRIVALGVMVSGSRDIYYATDKTTTTAIGKVIAKETAGLVEYFVIQFYKDTDCAVIASPEVMNESYIRNLSEFYNKKGTIARAYIPHELDVISFTAEGIDGTIAVGDEVIASAGKLKKKSA